MENSDSLWQRLEKRKAGRRRRRRFLLSSSYNKFKILSGDSGTSLVERSQEEVLVQITATTEVTPAKVKFEVLLRVNRKT